MLTLIMKLDSIKMISNIVCVKHPIFFYGCFFSHKLLLIWNTLVGNC